MHIAINIAKRSMCYLPKPGVRLLHFQHFRCLPPFRSQVLKYSCLQNNCTSHVSIFHLLNLETAILADQASPLALIDNTTSSSSCTTHGNAYRWEGSSGANETACRSCESPHIDEMINQERTHDPCACFLIQLVERHYVHHHAVDEEPKFPMLCIVDDSHKCPFLTTGRGPEDSFMPAPINLSRPRLSLASLSRTVSGSSSASGANMLTNSLPSASVKDRRAF